MQDRVGLLLVRPKEAFLDDGRQAVVRFRTILAELVEELAELIAVEQKMQKATAELKAMVLARESRLMGRRSLPTPAGPPPRQLTASPRPSPSMLS